MAGELNWDEAADRLATATGWWLATTGEQGPHSVPVWGVVVAGEPWFYSDPGSTKARNLAGDPRCVVHLESADDVLIVHGEARPAGEPAEQPNVVHAYHAKYADPGDAAYLPDAPEMAGIVLYRVTPRKALVWLVDDFLATQRRWVAP